MSILLNSNTLNSGTLNGTVVTEPTRSSLILSIPDYTKIVSMKGNNRGN